MYTDASGIINVICNDLDTHNLTMIFGGVLYEFIFSETISEDIVLNTKSIDAQLLWDEIGIPVDNFDVDTFDLLWFDGTSWIFVETIVRSGTGMIIFSSLIMGSYKVVKTGETDGYEFVIDQQADIYTTDIIIIPDKTIIDITYLDTIFGTDYTINFDDIDWLLETAKIADMVWITATADYYVYLNISGGVMTIYEITGITETNEYIWRITISNAWNEVFDITRDTTTEINLTAKSVEASFTWSSGGTIVVGVTMPLYFWNGVEFEFVANYVTDAEGKIIIIEMLPVGTFRFGDYPEFYVVIDDVVVFESYVVESTKKVISTFYGKGKGVFNINVFGRHINIFFFNFIGGN